MPNADWRTPSAYADVRDLTTSGYAWEYLRRDDGYRRDYDHVATMRGRDLTERSTFPQKWGLRFRGRPRPACHARADLLAARAAA